jgi:hypothetical protein
MRPTSPSDSPSVSGGIRGRMRGAARALDVRGLTDIRLVVAEQAYRNLLLRAAHRQPAWTRAVFACTPTTTIHRGSSRRRDSRYADVGLMTEYGDLDQTGREWPVAWRSSGG